MNNLSEYIDEILSLTYTIYKIKKSFENDVLLKKIFTYQLKKIYYELENFNVKSYIENDISTSKYGVVKLSTILDSFMIPMQGDFLSYIYNDSEFDIKFGLYIGSILISEYNLKSKENIYPLNNNAIIPLYLLNCGVRVIFYNQNSNDIKKNLIFIYRDLDDKHRKFLRLFRNNINYYIMNGNICNIIENGTYTEYNVENIHNYLYENDVCFDKNIIKFCIEI
jgi:hypothetical protein